MSIIDPTFELVSSKTHAIDRKYQTYRFKWNNNPLNFVVEDFPLHLDIELNTTCNLRCGMCFQANNNIPPQEMDL